MRLCALLLALLPAQKISAHVCKLSGYDFTGAFHSETYRLPRDKKEEGCSARKSLDEKVLGQKFLGNREKILALINSLLQDPLCNDSSDLLLSYLEKLDQHKRQFDLEIANKIRKFEQNKGRYDLQREFAPLGYLRNTCTGDYNKTTSFLDLDLINALPAARTPQKVTRDGELISDCADVTANGDAELKGFQVSLKKATGADFLFSFDPYSVPDQVILTENGKVLHDSGCTGADGRSVEPIRIPLSKLSGDKIVDVSVKWNCSSPDGSGGSAWEFYLRCQQENIGACPATKEELIELLKKEVQILKEYMDINAHERECFAYYDEDVLPLLVEDGLLSLDVDLGMNGFCPTMDLNCELRRAERKAKESPPIFSLNSGLIEPERKPTSEHELFHCPDKPGLESTIFERISWTYCRVGRKKLGID